MITTPKFIVLTLLICLNLTINAQFTEIAKSSPFPEPETGEAGLFLLSNGWTLYISLEKRTITSYKIFDNKHGEVIIPGLFKQLADTKVTLKNSYVFNNNIVLFVNYSNKGSVDLNRVTIDPVSKKIIEDVKIFSVSEEGGFVIAKDPDADHYAIVKREAISKKEDEFEMILFDGEHKEVSRAKLSGVETDPYKFHFSYKLHVVGNTAFAFGIQETKIGKYGRVKGKKYMATLQKSSNKVDYTALDVPEDISYSYIIVKYNSATRKLFYMIDEDEGKEKAGKGLFLNIIDVASKKVTKIESLLLDEKIHDSYKERFGKRSNYLATPQDFFVNDDGSFSIVFQEKYSASSSSGNYSVTFLGKVLVANYSNTGVSVSGYVLPKLQMLSESSFLTYFRNSENEYVDFLKGDQYKYPKYINGTNQKYILFNDTERNIDVKKDKYVEVRTISACDGFAFKLSGSEISPAREYVFGADPQKHSLGVFALSDYDKKTNLFVTIRTDKIGKEAMSNIVWLQPK